MDTPAQERLDERVRALIEAGSPSDVFRALLDGARSAVPRAAVFLLRQGRLKGWGSFGYPSDAAERQRAWSSAASEGWLGEIAGGADRPFLDRRDVATSDPDFGQPTATEQVGVAVAVRGRPIAIIVAERSGPEEPWEPSVLGAFVRVAQLRLELDVVRRKVESAAATAARGLEAAPAPPSARGYAVSTPADAPPAGPAETGLDPAAAPAAPGPGEDDDDRRELDSARRFARLIATDIRLYNEESVVRGRESGDLAERLHDPMHRGKETFLGRHGTLGDGALTVLHEAYVTVLAGGDEALLPRSALD